MDNFTEKDWLGLLAREFDHPAIVLWRAAEVREIEKILAGVKLPEPVLDLGCAEGKIAGVLFKGKSLIGLDNCWGLLSGNHHLETYKILMLADGCRLPYKNGTFGGVFSNCVIEHIPALDSVLEEVARVLKANGIFLFTVPSHKFGEYLFFSEIFNTMGLKGLARWYQNKRNKLLNHFHCYDLSRWKTILEGKGLSLSRYSYYMPRKATFIWDFLAFIVFCGNKLKIKGQKFLFSERLIRKGYEAECVNNEFGGALLLVARKEKVS